MQYDEQINMLIKEPEYQPIIIESLPGVNSFYYRLYSHLEDKVWEQNLDQHSLKL